MMDLFDDAGGTVVLAPGAMMLAGFARAHDRGVLAALAGVVGQSSFRHMVTPGGWRMSVAMTSCGRLGWVTDRKGYRYDPLDPDTGTAWPAMPPAFLDLAVRAAAAAGFTGFAPDTCLVNRYEPGSRLSLHQDRDERAFDAPIVSVSLGLPATFLWGGMTRAARPRRVHLTHGDVVVWGGPARLTFHGVDVLRSSEHEVTGPVRYNLTFRQAG
jgi:alkylated DNA repair protein (DNA oxidative demethylase)